MQGHEVRERLHAGRYVFGTHVASLTNPVTAGMQASLPYDFLLICNEHMPLDRTETSLMCQLYAARGISPIVRIPAPEPAYAAMALDGGAQGIVAPYVETVEQVRALVGAVRYRPVKGEKLAGYLAGRTTPSAPMQGFFDRFNRETYLIIGIESVAAYRNLDRLLGVPGVDGVFVGPHDMTVSMEIPEEYDHPDFRGLLADVIRRSRAAGLGVGVHVSPPIFSDERVGELLDLGMNWVLYAADVTVMSDAMRKKLALFRGRVSGLP